MSFASTLLIFFLSFILMTGCASRDKTGNDLDRKGESNLEISLNDLYIWANLMPGGEPKFHLTGNLKLKTDRYELIDTKLKGIRIIQEEVKIYDFVPDVEYSASENETVCEFRIDGGLRIPDRLDLDKKVDVTFLIGNDSEDYTFESTNQVIEKVY